MSDTIASIKGMPDNALHRLEAAGIMTTDDLLKQTSTPALRHHLASAIDVSERALTDWINRADLMRLNGVGKEMANLLEEAGVDSAKELKHRKADHLHERLHTLNQQKHITHHAPSMKQVQDWIEEAATFEPQ